MAGGGEGPHGGWGAFWHALAMILVSEAGDETFIIAAVMAMRHPKELVFGGAAGALALMTVISTALGRVVPTLISASLTQKLATLLYTGFGVRLLWIAYRAEVEDVEEEIHETEGKLEALDRGEGLRAGGVVGQVKALMLGCMRPIVVEALVLTFLAEWGDRSQIATITMAADMDAVAVTLGAVLGHCICTGAAVMGGELLAKRISQRAVAAAGGCLFLLFALVNVTRGGAGGGLGASGAAPPGAPAAR